MTATDIGVGSTSTGTSELQVQYPKVGYVRPRTPDSGSLQPGTAWSRQYQRLLLAGDIAVVCLVLAAAHLLRFGLEPGQAVVLPDAQAPLVAGFIALAWLGTLEAFRSREVRALGIGSEEYKRVINATLLVFGILAIMILALKLDLSRGYFAIALPLGLICLPLVRWLWRSWLTRQRVRGHYLSRVVVLGRPDDVRYVINQIQRKSGAAYDVVGAAVQGKNRKESVAVEGRSIPVVAGLDDVVAAAARVQADAVVVAGRVKGGNDYIRNLGWQLEESNTGLVLATGMTNVAGPRIHFRPVEGLPLMHVELPQFSGVKHLLKRMLDVVLAGTALLLLLPLLACIALWVHRDSAGPVVFRQQRIGRGGRTFWMYKFRSMVQTAEQDLEALREHNEGAGPLFKLRDDPRVTKAGRTLRKYSLDELPQIWNVLKGDMSLVGPRPPLQSEVTAYTGSVHRRLYIKPGLTGMWQVNGRSDLSWEDSVRLDLYYVENWSIAMDLMIIVRTARMLVKPVGAF
ncbi:MAG: sugar transferase [Micrococcaceae bacterium]|nr:sugar transferase [Micrococcaceae bacterium]